MNNIKTENGRSNGSYLECKQGENGLAEYLCPDCLMNQTENLANSCILTNNEKRSYIKRAILMYTDTSRKDAKEIANQLLSS